MSYKLRVTNAEGEEKWFNEERWVSDPDEAEEILDESMAEQLRDVTELAVPTSATVEVVPVE